MFPNNFPKKHCIYTIFFVMLHSHLNCGCMWNFVHLVYCYFWENHRGILMKRHGTSFHIMYSIDSFLFIFISYNTWLLKRCMGFKFGISSQQMLFNNWNKKSKVFVCVFYAVDKIHRHRGSCMEVRICYTIVWLDKMAIETVKMVINI